MTDKKDPICGMEGHIKKHNHYFCSEHCVTKYEEQHKIVSKKSPIFLYILIGIAIIALLIVLQRTNTMLPFMGIFFVLVAILKLIDWKGFATAFSQYDLIAKKSKIYSFAYPLIELGLGIAYLLKWQITIAAVLTLIIMVVGTIGVAQNLLSPNRVKCACLGTKIKLPLTKFTLVEDITMAIMALMILI